MDDRDQPDTNVVNLRRKHDPDSGQREELASTIFADEDEIGTFSRGNLVPPRASGPRTNGRSTAPADPFFDRYRQGPSNGTASDDNAAVDEDSTAEYFDRMNARTPAEMAASGTASAAPNAMPGSASSQPSFPRRPVADTGAASDRHAPAAHSAEVRQGAPAPSHSASAPCSPSLSEYSQRRARAPHRPARAAERRTRRRSTGSVLPCSHRSTARSPHVTQVLDRAIHHARPVRPHRARHKRPAAPTHGGTAAVAARYTPPPTGGGSPASPTTPRYQSSSGATSTSSQPVASSGSEASSAAASSAGSSGSSASRPSSQPAFGANGFLGPGHSPSS